MNSEKPSEDRELLELIKHFQKTKEEGRIPYLDAEQYEDIVDHYIFNNEYETAEEAIEMALQIHPDNTRLIATQAALYIDEGKLEEARETIDIILNNNSDLHVFLIHAELLVVESKIDEANMFIDSFKEKETDEIDCLDIGTFCYDVGFNEKALYWLHKCLEFNAENESAILTICETFQAMGQYAKTIDIYNKLIDKDPYSVDGWSGLGKSYFYLGQLDKAIEACDFALVSDDQAGEAYVIKGHAYYQLENYEESVEAYKEAWRLGNLEAEFAPMFIAFSYVGMEEWNYAYEYIKEAIAHTNENSPVFPDLLINSARCLHHMSKNKEAHSTLEFAQERFPNNPLPFIYSGKYYMEEGKKKKALTNFNKATAVSPTADTWYQIGLLAMDFEEFELALNAFEHVEKIDPDFEDLLQHKTYVSGQLSGDNHLILNRKILKQHIKDLVAKGKRPEPVDIDAFIRQSREEGKSEEEIDELVIALEELNDILENFDVDQEEDEMER